MDCWICGKEANSGEHIIKASDLKMLFGKVHQDKPIYLHTDQKRNQRVPGLQSDKLKFPKLMCTHCNNVLSQPADKAWQALSTYLREQGDLIKSGTKVRLAKLFQGKVNEKMVGVHLYFVKYFGCLIAENNIPIDIKGFSDAMLTGKPHPNIYIRFLSGLQNERYRLVSRTPVTAIEEGGRAVYASWIYRLDGIGVHVFYSELDKVESRHKGAYNPLRGARAVQFSNYDE